MRSNTPRSMTCESSLLAPSDSLALRWGFKPFQLAAVLMMLWFAVHGGPQKPEGDIVPSPWGAHEMLFGSMVTAAVSFRFTLGKSRLGLPTPRGAQPSAFLPMWLGGLIASVLATYPAYFLLDVSFLPLLTASFLDLLDRTRYFHLLPVAGGPALLSLSNLALRLGVSAAIDPPQLHTLHAAIALLVLRSFHIAGRVIPRFMMNTVPGVKVLDGRVRNPVNLGLTAAGLATWLRGLGAAVSTTALRVAAVGHVVRLISRSPREMRRCPMRWTLRAAYAWIPLGLLLLAASQLGLISVSAAVHALALGALGGLALGMRTRTARGHAGRAFEASRVEVTAFAVIIGTAVVRPLALMLAPALYGPAPRLVGSLWTTAFAFGRFPFAPGLLSPRVDGKDS